MDEKVALLLALWYVIHIRMGWVSCKPQFWSPSQKWNERCYLASMSLSFGHCSNPIRDIVQREMLMENYLMMMVEALRTESGHSTSKFPSIITRWFYSIVTVVVMEIFRSFSHFPYCILSEERGVVWRLRVNELRSCLIVSMCVIRRIVGLAHLDIDDWAGEKCYR